MGHIHVEDFIRGTGQADCGEAGERSWYGRRVSEVFGDWRSLDSVAEMIVGVRLEEDLGQIPPIGRKNPG